MAQHNHAPSAQEWSQLSSAPMAFSFSRDSPPSLKYGPHLAWTSHNPPSSTPFRSSTKMTLNLQVRHKPGFESEPGVEPKPGAEAEPESEPWSPTNRWPHFELFISTLILKPSPLIFPFPQEAASRHLLHLKKVYCSLTSFTAASHGLLQAPQCLLHLTSLTANSKRFSRFFNIGNVEKKSCYTLDNYKTIKFCF